METAIGKITAEPADAPPAAPAPPAGAATSDTADKSLPDPTSLAKKALLGLIVSAAIVALVFNWFEWTGEPFKPAAQGDANFALFAGFYVGAQVIAALMALVSPLLPPWPPPKDPSDPTKRVTGEVAAAYLKSDRSALVLGLSAVAGVAASCAFGLFFLTAIGMQVSNTVDTFFTGLVIAGGAKPLHDFIGLVQKPTNPTTGTGTSTS